MRRRISPSTTADAERVLGLCQADASQPAWLEVLRAAKPEIANAMRAQPLTVEVRLRGRRPLRLAISASGQVICPGGARDRPDVRLEGEARDVVAFLLGELSLIEAQRRGLLVLLTRVSPDRLGGLRRVIGRQLRSLISGPMAVLALVAPAGLRARRWMHGPVEIAAAAADRAAPTLITAVAALGGLAPASATQVDVATTALAAVLHPHSVQSSEPEAVVRQAPLGDPPPTSIKDVPPPAPPAGAAQPASVSATFGRGSDSFRTDVQGQADDNTERAPAWWWFRCDTEVRAAACDALDRLPTPGPLP